MTFSDFYLPDYAKHCASKHNLIEQKIYVYT